MGIIETLREFITAHYDPNLNMICGCRPGGFVWYHEQRHKEQFEHKIVSGILKSVHILFYTFSLFFLIFGLMNNFLKPSLHMIGLLAVPYLISLLLIEIDAWIVSVIRYWKSKRGD